MMIEDCPNLIDDARTLQRGGAYLVPCVTPTARTAPGGDVPGFFKLGPA